MKPLKLLRKKLLNNLHTGFGTARSECGTESRIHGVFHQGNAKFEIEALIFCSLLAKSTGLHSIILDF